MQVRASCSASGPILARNPALAGHILAAVTGTALAPLELADQAALRRTYLDPHTLRPPPA